MMNVELNCLLLVTMLLQTIIDHYNVVFKHSPLLTVLSVSKLLTTLDLSRDFSDVPISSILGNNHLQCKQCAYRPSYRCQQLRRNYIKYNYTFLRQPVLYAYTCYNRWAIYYFTKTYRNVKTLT